MHAPDDGGEAMATVEPHRERQGRRRSNLQVQHICENFFNSIGTNFPLLREYHVCVWLVDKVELQKKKRFESN